MYKRWDVSRQSRSHNRMCVNVCMFVRASVRTWILTSLRTCTTAAGNSVSVMTSTNLREIAVMCAGPCTRTDILAMTSYSFCTAV